MHIGAADLPDFKSTRADLKSGVNSMFRPNVMGSVSFSATIRGYNVTREHAMAVDALLPQALAVIHMVTGEEVTKQARSEIIRMDAIDSGDTHDSIHARFHTTPTLIATTVGPTTFYSPLIEFGLARHANFGPRPFMSAAFSEVLPHFLRACRELALIAKEGARGRITDPLYKDHLMALIRQFRAHLYTIEKEIGDIAPLGLPLSIGNAFRSNLIGTARILGDTQAVLGRTVGLRFQRRLTGKVTGRLIGIGSNTVFANRTFGARISGGERVYNRIAGRYTSRYVSQSRFLRGG